MNAFMNIQVRIASNRAAAQLRALDRGVQGLNEGLGENGRRARSSSQSMTSWGNQVQWTGRQIQMNWTLPLLAAGAAAFQWQMANEKAFTRIEKVYGSAGMAAETMRKELAALEDAFQALSDHYGVQQEQVLQIAGDWAAAGASGIALARGVEATLQAMVLGELKAAEATQALIAIQAQYGEDTKGLIRIIATLNMVENQTGASMAGLVKGFQRAAGVARSAGVDYRHLAAMIAALTPAAGSASEAGNALKTIFSRLASPTGETVDILNLMGIELGDLNWKSANATEQLQILSTKFQDLSDKQKEVVSTVIASRWQINKFSILMRELASENGYYAKALEATADEGRVYLQFHKELQHVLSSNPQRMQQIWVMLQNAMTDIIQPLIPIILYLANAVRVAVTAFSNLDPALQKLIIFGAIAIVAIGPILRYLGSLASLVGSLASMVTGVLGPLITAFSAVFGAIATLWVILWLRLRTIVLLGSAWITAAWTAGMFGLRTALAVAWAVIAAGWAALWALMPTTVAAGMIAIRAVWINGLFALAAAQIAIGHAMRVAWTATMTALGMSIAAVSYFVYPIAVQAWTAVMTGVFIVVNTWNRLILAAYAALTMGLAPLTAAAGAAVAATWRGILTAIQVILLAGTIVHQAIWRLYMFGLAPITAAAGRLLTAIWVATLRAQLAIMIAFQRAWAVIWAGLVIVANWGSRLIAFAAVRGAAAMAFLAAAPGRVLALFRAGWVLLVAVARAGVVALISAISWPVVAAVALVVLLIAGFWDELKQMWANIVSYFTSSGNGLVEAIRNVFGSLGRMMTRVFNMLPQSVKNAMLAVVRLVAAAARKVYEFFQYINPFARHSPSLVDNVTNGMSEIRKQFSKLSEVEGYVNSAYSTLSRFGGVANSLGMMGQEMQWSKQREDISKAAPGAVPAFDAMAGQVRALTPILDRLEGAMESQERVVDSWQIRLDSANQALDRQRRLLDKLQVVADRYSDRLNEAKQQLQDWTDTPLEGQRAMSDAIFENEMAQKRLRLEMMKMDEAAGSFDDVQSKLAAIRGEMDLLRGTRSSLAAAGAGSDVLGFYDKRIKSLAGKAADTATGGESSAIEKMQSELEELKSQAERMNLEQSLRFDPLRRKIDQASQSLREMPFDVIIEGVRTSKSRVNELTRAYDQATQAVKRQQAVINAAEATRDAVQARYDKENAKLKRLKDAYDAVNRAIQELNSSMQKMSSFASDKIQAAEKGTEEALSPAAKNFMAAEGGNFADVGKDMKIGREGGLGDQSGLIKDFTADLAKETAGMFAGLNPMGPLKRWWNKAWDWLKTYIGPLFTGLGDFIGAAFDNIPNPFSGGGGDWLSGLKSWIDPAKEMIKSVVTTVGDIFTTLWDWGKKIWGFLQPILEGIWDNLVLGLKDAWAAIGPEISKFKELLAPLGQMFKNLWIIIKPVLAIIAGAVAAAFLLLMDIIKNTIRPLLAMIGDVIGGVIRIIRGVIEFIVGVFTLDWEMAWNGIKDIFGGVWDVIWGIIKGAVKLVIGVIKGLVDWCMRILLVLWDKYIVPAWDASIAWLKKIIWSHINGILKNLKGAYNWLKDVFFYVMGSLARNWKKSMDYLKRTAVSLMGSIMRPLYNAYDWLRDKLGSIMGWVGDKIKRQLETIGKWTRKAANWIADPLKGAINKTIGFVNKLISGLNKLSDVLPGFDWHISAIPKLAMGGGLPTSQVGSGFMTHGARAIVGEGNPRYPEYVIPTDPQYNKRAKGLFTLLGRDLGVTQGFMGSVPMLEGGGILGGIKDALGGAGDFFTGLSGKLMSHVSDGLATYVMKPFFNMADPLINQIPWKMAREMAKAGKNQLVDWLSFADEAAKDKVAAGGASNVPAGQIKNWILQALRVIDEPTNLAHGIYNIIKHESGGNPRAINRWDSNAAQGYDMMSKGLMQTIGPTFRSWAIPGHTNIWNPIDNIIAGTRYAINRYGRDWLRGGGNRDSNGNYIGYEIGGILGKIPSLSDGAYIRRKVGGTLVRVGEGREDEAVVPLPNGMDSLGGGKEYNFYGDLSFPNVRSGEDAQSFLENLETLTAR